MRNTVIATLVAGAMSAGMAAGTHASPPERVDSYMTTPAYQSGATGQSVRENDLGGRQVGTDRGYWRPKVDMKQSRAHQNRSTEVPTFGRVPQAPYGGSVGG